MKTVVVFTLYLMRMRVIGLKSMKRHLVEEVEIITTREMHLSLLKIQVMQLDQKLEARRRVAGRRGEVTETIITDLDVYCKYHI